MKLLVTGGLGFIGSQFVREGLRRGHTIHIIDKLTYAASLENLSDISKNEYRLTILDIANREKMEQFASDQHGFDAVVNFAAESHVDRSILDSSPFVQSNIVGVNVLLDLVRSGFAKRFLQVSTDEVYGSSIEGSWKEDAPLAPRSPYSASKAAADLMCLAYLNTYGIRINITRCANNYGPRQSVEKFIPNSINSLVKGRSIPIYGDGLNRREWLHVIDHVKGILCILEKENPDSVIYNIGGTEMTNIEVANIISQLISPGENKIEFVKDRAGHDFRYSCDYRRLANEFGWSPSINFVDGIAETTSWYLANMDWVVQSEERLSS